MAEETKLSGPDLAEEGISVEDLGTDIPATGHYQGKAVVVATTTNGICAVAGSCTHYGGPLGDGICVDGQIRCPWHHAAFDLETGEAVRAPALNPIQVYDTVERDGRVYVTGARETSAVERRPATEPDSVVIIGSGPAGAAAAEALRRYGYRGPITMIGEEAPVDRPNLSKDFLAGTAPEEWLPLRSTGFYSDKDIELITGATVASIDAGEKTVTLSDGRRFEYGALLLATGAEPRRLPVPGGDLPHVHVLRTVADTMAIIDGIEDAGRVVVVGAGFIGLEVAASLRKREIEVTVVAPEDLPLAGILGDTMARSVHKVHVEHGVDFRLGRGVSAIEAGTVTLDDGSSLEADLVVVGIGVVPRTGLAEAAGLTVDRGIVVDNLLRTDDSHIWAAGDVASYPGPGGDRVRVEHFVHAELQGQAAARNILGQEEPYQHPPFFWSQHYDLVINVTGHLGGWDDKTVIGDPDERDVIVGYRKGGEVVAVASVYRDRESLRAEHALARGDQGALDELLASD